MNRDILSKSLNPIGIGPYVSGYLKGVTEYLEGDVGADLTAFDVDAVIGTAWESVGPTGSGATNIWTVLDIVPIGAKWVEIKIYNSAADSSGQTANQSLYGRKTGSSAAVVFGSAISYNSFTAGGATTATLVKIDTIKLPVDASGRFDLYRTSIAGDSFSMQIYLIGWGI